MGFILGGCNGNGIVTMADVTTAVIKAFSGQYSPACDVVPDGVLNNMDFFGIVMIFFGVFGA